MIDTVVFDLSDVLIFGLKGVEFVIGQRLGLQARDVLQAMLGEPFDALMRGQLSEVDYLQGILEREKWPMPLAEIQALIRHNMRQRIPGSVELLHDLAPHCRLYLLSDHATEWVEDLLPEHTFLGLFTERFWSCELGSIKRDPQTFPLVLDRIGRPAYDCLFVDDNPKNVAAAAASSIEGIVFEDALILRREFAQRGLLV